MTFAEPIWLFVGLIVYGLLAWGWLSYDKRQRKALASFAASHLHAQLIASFSTVGRLWKRGLFLASVALLFVALARPQAGFRWEETKRRGIEILFAVDTSKSMLTPDVNPDRLSRAKLAVDDFVSHLDGDGVGLVAFAGNAFLQCPITLDYNAFNESLAALDTNTIPRGGTNISSAIREAVAALQTRPSTDKILILLTDGENLEGNAVDTAKAAAQAGLKIYTVGVGTANGGVIPLPAESGGGFVKDDSGQYVKSHLDETTLQAIAKATGGIYAPLGAQGQGLDTIYQTALAPLAKHDLASREQRVYIERYQWFLPPALLLLLASLVVGTRRNIKRTRTEDKVPVPTMPRRRLVPQNAVALIGLTLLCSFTSARASISDAENAYKKGDFTTAANEFAAAAQNHSEKNVLQFDAGTAAYKAGQFAQAAEDFQKSLAVQPAADPKLVAAQQDAYYNLGNTLYRAGQKTEKANAQQTTQSWEQAVKSYDAALQLRADDADAKFNRDLVQRKLDDLKKQQQKQQDQKQDQQKHQRQNQGQQGKNQENQSGQGSNDKNNTADKGNSQNQPKSSEGQQSQNQANSGSQPNQGQPKNPGQQPDQKPSGGQQSQNQANNSGAQPNQGQPKSSGQQPGQSPTAQNPGNQQGQAPKPDQQANSGPQNGPSQAPQPQPGQRPASGSPGSGTPLAQNGKPSDQAGQAAEQRVPGQMTKQEASQLLDSLRDEQRPMPGNPVARGGNDNSPDQPYKDW
jgi:Ca-activated chloride channel family protein